MKPTYLVAICSSYQEEGNKQGGVQGGICRARTLSQMASRPREEIPTPYVLNGWSTGSTSTHFHRYDIEFPIVVGRHDAGLPSGS